MKVKGQSLAEHVVLGVGYQGTGDSVRANCVGRGDGLRSVGTSECAGIIGRPRQEVAGGEFVGQGDRHQGKVNGRAPCTIPCCRRWSITSSGVDVDFRGRSPCSPASSLREGREPHVSPIGRGKGSCLESGVVNVRAVSNISVRIPITTRISSQ